MTSAFHPQTDGQTERLNRTLEEMLRSLGANTDWDDHLALAEFAYNNSTQVSTGYSPFSLDGVQPFTPECLWNPKAKPQQEFLADAAIRLQAAKDHLHAAQQHQAAIRNTQRRHQEFSPGDWVLVQSTRFARSVLDPEGHGKLKPRYIGPFQIQGKIGPVTYRLELPPGAKVHNAFHVELLKPYNFSTPSKSPSLTEILKELKRLQAEFGAETAQSGGGGCNKGEIPWELDQEVFEK
jgi:hypothetical protein